MAKRFKVMIQGVADTFEVEAAGSNRVAAIIAQDPDRFQLSKATRDGVIGVENAANGKASFYKMGGSCRSTLYPISASAAATVMAMAA